MKLDGFGIFVKDMKKIVYFYRDVLGFEIKEDENATNVYLEKDGTLFLLYRRTDFGKMTNRTYEYANNINGHYEIALSVENYSAVDEAFKAVISKGATPILEPTTEAWGQRTCYIADPEGNLIEIGSFIKQKRTYQYIKKKKHCLIGEIKNGGINKAAQHCCKAGSTACAGGNYNN